MAFRPPAPESCHLTPSRWGTMLPSSPRRKAAWLVMPARTRNVIGYARTEHGRGRPSAPGISELGLRWRESFFCALWRLRISRASGPGDGSNTPSSDGSAASAIGLLRAEFQNKLEPYWNHGEALGDCGQKKRPAFAGLL